MNKIYRNILLLFFIPVLVDAQQAGTLDSTFNGTGIVLHSTNPLSKTSFQRIRIQPDGKSVVFGYAATDFLWERRTTVTRFNTDGTPDAGFGVNGTCLVEDFPSQGLEGHILPDGSILAAATGFFPNTIAFIKITANGKVDSTFGVNGIVANYQASNANLKSSFLLPDGKIIVIANYYPGADNYPLTFAGRYLANGQPDTTFGNAGIFNIEHPGGELINDISGGGIQPDGKIMIVGSTGQKTTSIYDNWLLIRLNPEGTLDESFGNGGKVVISMGTNFSESCNDVIFLPDGKFLGGGYAQKAPGFHFTVARFNNDGSLDPSFGFNGKSQIGMNCCYSVILDMEMQADGKIVACGYSSEDNDVLNFAIARFKANGAVDQTFGNTGRLILAFEPDTSQIAPTIAIQNDHKILVGGYNSRIDEFEGMGVMVRLHPGPVLVNTFTPENAGVTDLQVYPNPVSGNTLALQYTLETTIPLTIDLYDLTGRKIADIFEKATRYEGENQEDIPLPADLPAGQYYLRMMTDNGFAGMKFVKL